MIECSVCGSGTTLPVVPEDQFGPFYAAPAGEDPYGNYDQWRPVGALAIALNFAKRLHALIKAHTLPFNRLNESTGRALDVGCGTGEVSLFLGGRGWRTYGIEPDARTAEFARSRGLEVETGTWAHASPEPSAFDAVVFHHVLEHVADPAEALATAHAALRPGGRLIVCVPNFASWQSRLFRDRWFALDTPRHRHHMTPDGLVRLAERCGFTVESIGSAASLQTLPASIEIAFRGHTAVHGGMGARLQALASLVVLMPINLIVTALTRRGDTLNLVASAPSDSDR